MSWIKNPDVYIRCSFLYDQFTKTSRIKKSWK